MNKEIKSIYRADFFIPTKWGGTVAGLVASHNYGNQSLTIPQMASCLNAITVDRDKLQISIEAEDPPTEISVHYEGELAISIRLHQVYDFAGIEAGIMTLKQGE